MRTTSRKRMGAIAAALALLSTVTVLTVTQQVARADTTQNYACYSPLTSTYATFPIPITGSGAPNPIVAGATTDFTGLSVTVAINPSLVIAGIGAGVLDYQDDPAQLGVLEDVDGDFSVDDDGVNSGTNSTFARLSATNSVEGNYFATGGTTFDFWVVWDGADPANLQIYVETAPGSWSGLGTTGLVQVPQVPVVIPLTDDGVADGSAGAPLTATSDGTGDIALQSRLGPLPAILSAPTTGERNGAPLVLLNDLGVAANFYCWPGTSTGAIDPITGLPGSSADFAPAASASAIDTVAVNIPPTSPVGNPDFASVGAGQAVTINVAANDTDVNGDLVPASVAVVPGSGPTNGTLVNNGNGTIEYTNNGTPGPDSFEYTIDDGDATTAPSGNTLVTIDVLGNLCEATAGDPLLGTQTTPGCSLDQVLIVPILGSSMTLEQDGLANDFQVTMIDAASIAGLDEIPGTADDDLSNPTPVVLNGQPQLAVGQLYTTTVTNARGTDARWDLTGQVTAFTDGTVAPTCTADPGTWNNHCIPGDNLGWAPSAGVAHTQVLGDVAAVDAGDALYPPGFLLSAGPLEPTGLGNSAQTLCSAEPGVSGGTFTCGAGLALSIPASTAAGTYVAVMTLTLA